MARRSPAPALTITLRPLPPVTWTGFGWEGTAKLPSWRGWQTHPRRSDGSAPLVVCHPICQDDEPRLLPSPEQRAAFGVLMTDEKAIAAAAQRALYRYARPELAYARADLADNGRDPAEIPAVRSRDDLRRVARLAAVQLLTESHRGVSYVGLQLQCLWDDEHGAGILLHRKRVVSVGHADVAFDGGTAQADAERQPPRRRA